MAEKKIYDVAVIGAGIAGLTAAALLQNDGAKVLLLEQHDKPGGCAGYFDVDDVVLGRFRFDVGATVALGFDAHGLHRRVFDRLSVHDYEAELLDGLRVVLPGYEIFMARDSAVWRKQRRKLPGNRAGQELFWRIQGLVADAGWNALKRLPSLPMQTSRDWLRALRLAHPDLAPMLPFLRSTVGDVLRFSRVENDREFVALVNLALMITVQEEAHRTPFTNGCAGLDLWRHGSWHLRGGMGEISRLLMAAFERDDGTAYFGQRVEKIRPLTSGGFEIEVRNRESVRAAKVVANVPLHNVADMVELPPRAVRNVSKLAERTQERWGAVTLYAALREEAVPATTPLHQQVLLDYEAQPGDGRDVFLSLSAPGDEAQAPHGWRTLTVSTHVRLQEWSGLSGQQYRAQKRQWRKRLLEGIRRALPAFDEKRKFVLTGTPQTWHDYTLRDGGSVGGARLTLANANFIALPQRIGLRNFWIVGDTTFPGQGTVACALSGINAWRDITGAVEL
jgi:C-3',4' desaturase CrtD